jgi:hypothetical protein
MVFKHCLCPHIENIHVYSGSFVTRGELIIELTSHKFILLQWLVYHRIIIII